MGDNNNKKSIRLPYSLLVWIITIIFVAGGVVASLKYMSIRLDKVEAKQEQNESDCTKFQFDIGTRLGNIEGKLDSILKQL